jgi:hypothetical protein
MPHKWGQRADNLNKSMMMVFIISNQIIIPKINKDNYGIFEQLERRASMSNMNPDYSRSYKNSLNSNINKVISDLKEGSDIEGVVLVEGRDRVIECNMPYEKFCRIEIPELIDNLENGKDLALSQHQSGVLKQHILDYNEYKVLAKRLEDDLTLLVLLQNRGYVSLAMLDVEISTRRISEILRVHSSKDSTSSLDSYTNAP